MTHLKEQCCIQRHGLVVSLEKDWQKVYSSPAQHLRFLDSKSNPFSCPLQRVLRLQHCVCLYMRHGLDYCREDNWIFLEIRRLAEAGPADPHRSSSSSLCLARTHVFSENWFTTAFRFNWCAPLIPIIPQSYISSPPCIIPMHRFGDSMRQGFLNK